MFLCDRHISIHTPYPVRGVDDDLRLQQEFLLILYLVFLIDPRLPWLSLHT